MTDKADGDTKQVAKNSAVGTLVVLGILGVLALIIVPIVVHQQNQAEEEQRHRERVSELACQEAGFADC